MPGPEAVVQHAAAVYRVADEKIAQVQLFM